MKKIYLFLFCALVYSRLLAENNMAYIVSKPDQDINVVVNNVCEYYSVMMICDRDSAAANHPILASANCMQSLHYTFYDSLMLFTHPKFLSFANYGAAPYGTQRMFVADEATILSFDATYIQYSCDSVSITAVDTFLTDSIVSGVANTTQVIYIRNTATSNNFCVYDLNFSFFYSLHLNMTPLFISSNESSSFAAVVGVNQNNETVLNLINLSTQQIIKDTVLGMFAAKPSSVAVRANDTFIISQPGDSVINFFKYTYTTGLADSAQLYSGSGVNAGAWESYKYHFQPEEDVTGNNSDHKVFILDTYFMTMDSFDIGKKLKSLISPLGVNYSDYPYLVGVDSLQPNMALFYSDYNYWLADSFMTPSPPVLFAGDFRCPVKITEYDDSKVQWKIFPNPSTDNFKLSASGLICGREYKLDIIDETGKVVYKTTTHAKMTVVLPTSDFEPGIYFVRIHTLNGPVVQKIIKQ